MVTKKKITNKKPTSTDYKALYQDIKTKFSIASDTIEYYEIANGVLKNQVSDQLKEFSERLAITKAESVNLIKPDKYNSLRSSLLGCLSAQELDAAEVTGCAPEVYAIELLKMFQEWKKKPKDTQDISQKWDYR